MKNKERILIVGAGVAGLTAGSFLSKNDYDVQIVGKTTVSVDW